MSEQVYSLAKDLSEARAMIERLPGYVRGADLYMQLGGLGALFGGSDMPSLTVGALRLRLRRLGVLSEQMSAEQRAQLAALQAQHATIRAEWRVHYDAKMTREAESRLDAVRRFIEDCAENPRQCAGNYLPEALRRTIVEELIDAMEADGIDTDTVIPKARETDARLRRYAGKPGGFLWAEMLKPVYPDKKFWWLYARPES